MELLHCLTCSIFAEEGAAVCPSCGGALTREPTRGQGSVLAATELFAPAEGWPTPHRLLWVRLEEGAVLIALASGELPAIGTKGEVRRDAEQRWVFSPKGGTTSSH